MSFRQAPFPIHCDEDRRRLAKRVLESPAGTIWWARKARRSDEQSALFHVKVAELAENVRFDGDQGLGFYSADKLKDVLVSALWPPDLVPHPMGEGVVPVRRSTADLDAQDMGLLIDFVDAVAARHGYTFKAYRPGDPRAGSKRSK